MDHKQRFMATVNREPVDRPASWLGLPEPGSHAGLFKYFGVRDVDELKNKLDDDVYPVEMPYHSPVSDAVYMAFDFAKKGRASDDGRTLTAPGFFEDIDDPDRIDEFDWPDPAKYISADLCREVVNRIPQDYAVLGIVWSAHFQDACAAFGMETALLKMVMVPEMFKAIIDRITHFYLRANEIFYDATRDRLDAVLIGNDFGSQTGLMLSPDLIRKHVWPGTEKLVKQAKSCGLKVIHHSCGAIYEIIPDLIELGVDVIHPIQALAKNMAPDILKRDFGDKVSFCGGVDAQNLLVNGSPEQIKAKVRQLKDLFPTGLVVSPSHEAILPDIPPENIDAVFKAIKN